MKFLRRTQCFQQTRRVLRSAVFILALPLGAAVTNVRVVDVSNTQALLKFTAPDANACTIEVSEDSDYDPLVHDVNGTHYSGASLDSRESSLQRGRERTVVIGKRTIERAASGIAYSRALQAATQHFYRITCGGDSATGTFTTLPPPLGDTHGDAPIADPDYPGRVMQITPQFTRNSTWIDPHTGVLIKRVHQPQDNNIFQVANDNLFTSVLESTNWTNPNNVLSVADAGASATYDGASCGGTCDWLKLSLTYNITTSYENRLDVLRVSINGSGSDATAANRTVEVCPVTLGATTIDAEGACKDIILPQTTAAKVTATVSGIQDTWRAPGKHEWTLVQIAPYAHLRFAVRKKNSTGTISVDAVRIDIWNSTTSNVGTGGSYDRCSTVLRGDGRYLCSSFNATGAGNLYSIHAETGDSRFLGAVYSNNSLPMTVDNWLWSATDANVWYGQGSGDSDQYSYTYTGDGSEVAAGTKVTLTQSALRAGGEALGTAVQTFVAAHTAEYGGRTFSPSDYACPVDAVHGDYLMMSCKRGGQDTYGWLAVYRISTAAIVAAMPMFAAPVSRWCVIHARDTAGASPASLISTQFFKNSYAGNGYHQSTLVGDITSGTTSVTVTSTCGGDATCASHVAGEPVATVGDKFLQAAETGDVFAIDSEYIRIGTKNSPTSWTIVRGVNGSTPASHSNGATFNATCANKPGAGPAQYISAPMMVWNFLGDPYGMDATGTYTWLNAYIGHQTVRLNVIVNNKSVALAAEGADILATVKDPAYTASVPEAATFAGKAAPSSGNTWQQHPNNAHVAASATERKFFFDVRPFEGGGGVNPFTPVCTITNPVYPASGGCAAARVSGFSNVYRIATTSADANPDDVNPRHFDLFGMAGERMLRDVSGPSSVLDDSAGKDYTFCHVIVANECVTGSSPGQTYVQIPSLVTPYCNTNTSTVDVCLSDYMGTGSTLSHYGFLANKEGLPASAAANAAAYGSSWTRRLAMHGLTQSPRLISVFSTGKPLANGKWVLATDWMEAPYGRGTLAAVKVPPIAKDSRNRSTFQSISVPSGTVPTGTDNMIVEFGYSEHGTATNFYCTSRAESCVAVGSSIDATTPFYWASESFSGLSCGSGCTAVIPALPGRTVYYRRKFRNSGGTVLLTGPLEAKIVF